MAKKMPVWITVDQAAELSGYNKTYIRDLYLNGLISYIKKQKDDPRFAGHHEKINVLVDRDSVLARGVRTNRMPKRKSA